MAQSLQKQGVPIPDRLGTRSYQPKHRKVSNESSRNPGRHRRTSRSAPQHQSSGNGSDITGADIENELRSRDAVRNSGRPRTTANLTDTSGEGGGIGGLEAEFLAALGILILLMFADRSSSYAEKIMSVIKRGSLTCLLFFILALLSGTGPNAAKIAKAFGALIIVGILLTSPVNTVFTDVDSLIKNDWVGTSESGGTGTSDTGTQNSGSQPSSGSNPLSSLEQLGQDAMAIIRKTNPLFTASDALKKLFHL